MVHASCSALKNKIFVFIVYIYMSVNQYIYIYSYIYMHIYQSGRQSRGLGHFSCLEGLKLTTVTWIRSFFLPGRPKVDDSHGD